MFGAIVKKIRKMFYSPEKWARYLGVSIGSNNLIGKNHWSSEPYLITVGSNCQLTNCKIHTHGGGIVVRDKIPDFDMFGKVSIGDWVYIGTNAQIMPGVTIQNNVLVAAGSIVTKSVPSGCIVAGNPAKIIGHIDDYINRNAQWNLGIKGLSHEDKRKVLLSMPDDCFVKKPFLDSNCK